MAEYVKIWTFSREFAIIRYSAEGKIVEKVLTLVQC